MTLPIFALNTVLFPGGVLPLRIFEARYLDMARECLRDGQPFGVCLVARGREVGGAATTEAVGCTATIAEWDMQQLGLLLVRAVGGTRFRIRARSVQPDGLLRAEVEPIAPDADGPLAPAHADCADLLRRIVDDLDAQRAARQASAEPPVLGGPPFEPPHRFDSRVWVGNRLCEVLPVPLAAKQKLMELPDASARLDIVTRYLKQHAVLEP
ncbi:MAG: LON peptidase substrate-binding domain-containing protein [Betaproteobacteria bacterium]|jgi:Lon protease-like protein